MKRTIAVFPLVVLFFVCADAHVLAQGTYNAASCSQSAVNAVINGPTHVAVDGDTINIPAGSCTWTSGITVPSGIGIAVIGSGTPDSGSSTRDASSSCASGTSLTLSGNFTAFTMAPKYGNSTSRLSCMTLTYGSGQVIAFKVLGNCTASGCPNLRMDNVTFSNWAGHTEAGISYGIGAIGDMFGVIDHNTINGSSGNYLQLVEQSNASYLGVGYYGDNSWAQPESYGSANFLFFENNTFNDAGATENEGTAGTLQNMGGGRVVARYNTFTNIDYINAALLWHGTESSGRPRSTRAWEFYENTLNCPSGIECAPAVAARGGTGLTWGNTFTFASGSGLNDLIVLNTYRTEGNPGASSWQGACDGSSAYDTNDGTTYYSGTITNVAGSTITVSGSPGWTTNQWFQKGAPYSLHDVTKSNGTEISGNGSNTLTLVLGGGPGAYTPSNGDSIQLLRATACIDQAGGRGAGRLYSGTPVSPASPANEAVSPAYEWMDSLGATPGFGVVSPDTARVIANRDFYMESVNQPAQTSPTSPFNGSSGMGHGTNANKPTSCTTGVGYWATDQSELYLCTATNTWTASYTPYTYPHPLTTGTAPDPPAAPSGLQATVQ